MHKDFIIQKPEFQIAKLTNNFNSISSSLKIQQVVKPFSRKRHKHYKLS
jgi:hypothetical protein